MAVTANQPIRPVGLPPALDPAVLGPARAVAARHFPGLAILPVMSTGATDGIFLEAVGIPTYGVPGILSNPETTRAHGLNERMEVRALYEGRDYLWDLVRAYAG